jgi:protocatechuate 3,4-dioxygenase, alpha subunit
MPEAKARRRSKGGGTTGGGKQGITPSQTVGPFFAYCLTPRDYGYPEIFSNEIATDDAQGQRIRIEGRVLDGDGQPVSDAMVEIWQADGQGRYVQAAEAAARPNTAFRGFGRSDTDADGRYSFATVKPGPVPGPNGAMQAPHINVSVFARGLLRHLFTRIYFEGEAANARDPILALVPQDGRGTLIARRVGQGEAPTFRFDIRLQGENETAFFET